jgi:hypothetical protein
LPRRRIDTHANPAPIEMSYPPLMLRFIEEELSGTPALIQRVTASAISQLQHATRPESTSSRDERLVRSEVMESLLSSTPEFTQLFADKLREIVTNELGGRLQSTASGGHSGATGFDLVDEGRVDADIEISRATQAIDQAAEWELRELQTFTSALAGQTHVIANANPLRPSAYAQALWHATCAITPRLTHRRLLLRTVAGCLAGQLKMSWAAACTRLEGQGIEPSAYKTTAFPSGTAAQAAKANRPGAQRLDHLLSRMPGAASGGGALPAPAPGTSTAGPNVSAGEQGARFSAAFEQTLQSIEGLLRSHAAAGPGAVGGAPNASLPLHEHSTSLAAHAADGIDRQIVELLSRLFEAVLCDDQLSAATRAVLARLQVSALRVALSDATMLESDQHPVWQLMNRIAAAAGLWPRSDDPRTAQLLAFSESLATQIAATSQPSTELYSRGLEQLEEHLAQQQQAQRDESLALIESLVLADRRETLQDELSEQFAEPFSSITNAPRVVDFMKREWPRVVAESLLRFGADNEHSAALLKVVDDLPASLRVDPSQRQQLFSLLPPLLKRLREGMALIALPEARQKALLDDLMDAHHQLLGFSKRADDLGLSDTPPVDKPVWADTQPAEETAAEAMIEVASMDTVPAELLSTDEGLQAMADSLTEHIVLAQPCQWLIGGRWQQVQLLWRSESARFFLFAGETAGCPHSITGVALERLGREGLIKPLTDSQLLQRAMDRVAEQLGQPRR